MRPKRVYRYGCEYEYAAERRRHLLVRRSVVLGERRLAASRGLAGKRQHSSSSRINNRDRDDDRAVAGHGAAVGQVGCNQIYTRSVLRLAWPACDLPWLERRRCEGPLAARSLWGRDSFCVFTRVGYASLSASGLHLLLGSTYSSIALLAASTCLILDQVRPDIVTSSRCHA